MHCTWFNEKKKRLISPIFFCGLFPLLNTSPHLSPSSSLPAPYTTTWERSATPPQSSRGYLAGHLGPRPSWPAASDLARGVCPAIPQRPQPDCPRPTERRTRPGRDPLSLALSSDPV